MTYKIYKEKRTGNYFGIHSTEEERLEFMISLASREDINKTERAFHYAMQNPLNGVIDLSDLCAYNGLLSEINNYFSWKSGHYLLDKEFHTLILKNAHLDGRIIDSYYIEGGFSYIINFLLYSQVQVIDLSNTGLNDKMGEELLELIDKNKYIQNIILEDNPNLSKKIIERIENSFDYVPQMMATFRVMDELRHQQLETRHNQNKSNDAPAVPLSFFFQNPKDEKPSSELNSLRQNISYLPPELRLNIFQQVYNNFSPVSDKKIDNYAEEIRSKFNS